MLIGFDAMITGGEILHDSIYALKHKEIETKGLWFWSKVFWLILLWPFTIIYLFFKPVCKILLTILKFMGCVIIYPFKLLFDLFKIDFKNKEPLQDRIAKWLVKKYKL